MTQIGEKKEKKIKTRIEFITGRTLI